MSESMQPTGALLAARQRRGTALETAVAQSPLRFLFPKPNFSRGAHPAWVCMTTLGGGLVHGDAIDLDVEVKPLATLLLTTQASTKIFRGASNQTFRARVAGTLVVWMDPTSCFADANYSQRTDIDLSPGGSVIWIESVTSGRPAFEAPFSFEKYSSKIRITQNGVPLLIDSLLLDRVHGSISARFARAKKKSFDTLSTIVAIGPSAAPLISALLAPGDFSQHAFDDLAVAPTSLSSCSACGAGVLVRIAATSAERAVAETRRRLRNLPEILMTDPFAFRW